jgi:hypothetical protein
VAAWYKLLHASGSSAAHSSTVWHTQLLFHCIKKWHRASICCLRLFTDALSNFLNHCYNLECHGRKFQFIAKLKTGNESISKSHCSTLGLVATKHYNKTEQKNACRSLSGLDWEIGKSKQTYLQLLSCRHLAAVPPLPTTVDHVVLGHNTWQWVTTGSSRLHITAYARLRL